MYNSVQNNKYKLKHILKASPILIVIISNSLFVNSYKDNDQLRFYRGISLFFKKKI